VVCPLNEKQERRVYQWIKKNTHDFNTVQILEWSPVAKAAKGIFEKDTGSVSFKVMIRASTVGGGITKSVIAFTMDPNGYVDSMFADADGYSAINLDPSTADMSVGRVVYENRLTYLLAR
jgi:hypothetical protein